MALSMVCGTKRLPVSRKNKTQHDMSFQMPVLACGNSFPSKWPNEAGTYLHTHVYTHTYIHIYIYIYTFRSEFSSLDGELLGSQSTQRFSRPKASGQDG
jgi:hypothetical protein